MTTKLSFTMLAAWLAIACSTSAEQTTGASTQPAAPAIAPSAPPAQAAQQMPKGSNVNSDAGVLADFKARVDAYDDLRKDMQKKASPLKETDDPAKIVLAEKALAQQIRAARAHAKRGDVFTPATEAMFRRLLRPQVTGSKDAADNKAIIKDDAPKPGEVSFKVNGEYPKEIPLSTVPPDVLKALPPLPENLEFRFVGKHLLLYCTRGNIIVDYMLNAIP